MRTLCWISQGAASVMAAKLELSVNRDAILIRCETGNEDEDNARFEADVVRWLNAPVTVIKSTDFDSVVDVWEKRQFMAGHHGAPCTTEMKIIPRLEFQKPDDVHIFGYTADAPDVKRFKRLQENFPELTVRAPLIERGITKSSAMAMLWRANIAPPRTYAMGFPNANCLQTGCVKATSPDYWALFRLRFPDRFRAMAERSRRIGARLTRINDERIFIDEIPEDWPVLNPEVPVCDFLCALAEQDMEVAA